MAITVRQPRPFTGTRMLVITLAFFAVVVSANGLMAWFATSTWSGLVVENGYVASQSFNQDAARMRTQEKLGWQVGLVHESNRIFLRFRDHEGAPLSHLVIAAKLQRPTTDHDDHTLTFSEAEPGQYTAEANLVPGLWDIELSVTGATAESFVKSFRLVAK